MWESTEFMLGIATARRQFFPPKTQMGILLPFGGLL